MARFISVPEAAVISVSAVKVQDEALVMELISSILYVIKCMIA